MKFEHIQGKENMVADMISRLATFGLYQDNSNEEIQLSLENAIENIIDEIHNVRSAPYTLAYTKIDKLNLDLLSKEQLPDRFFKKNIKDIKTKPEPSFILDKNNILRKQ